jgi:Uri superfamily endonuclease
VSPGIADAERELCRWLIRRYPVKKGDPPRPQLGALAVWLRLMHDGRPVGHLAPLIRAAAEGDNGESGQAWAAAARYPAAVSDAAKDAGCPERLFDFLDRLERQFRPGTDDIYDTENALRQLPSERGTYVLTLQAIAPGEVMVGRKKKSQRLLQVEPGFYLYVGSARKRGGVHNRLSHHLKPAHHLHPHWQVDFLRFLCRLTEIWYTLDPEKRECAWAGRVPGLEGAEMPMKKFGANDCKCQAHLYFFRERPSFEAFRRMQPAKEVPAQQLRLRRRQAQVALDPLARCGDSGVVDLPAPLA